MITLVKSGFGSWTEILALREKHDIEYLMEIQNVLNIIHQEEQLDGR